MGGIRGIPYERNAIGEPSGAPKPQRVRRSRKKGMLLADSSLLPLPLGGRFRRRFTAYLPMAWLPFPIPENSNPRTSGWIPRNGRPFATPGPTADPSESTRSATSSKSLSTTDRRSSSSPTPRRCARRWRRARNCPTGRSSSRISTGTVSRIPDASSAKTSRTSGASGTTGPGGRHPLRLPDSGSNPASSDASRFSTTTDRSASRSAASRGSGRP